MATQDDNPERGPLDHLPEALLERIGRDVAPQDVRAAAAYDLDADGRYIEGYLVLADTRLGTFELREGAWHGEWIGREAFDEAKIVEGLGLNLLRLVAGGRRVAEYRFTLRHAKAVARLHRRLERGLQGKTDDDEPTEEPAGEDDKKLRCGKCGRVIPAWSEFCPACMSRRKILWRLLDYVKPYKGRAAVGAALALALTCVGMVQPWLVRPMIDQGLAKGSYGVVLRYALLIVGLVTIGLLGRVVQMRLVFRLGTMITRDLRESVYAHLHKLSLSFFAKKQTGSLVTRVTTDTDRLWRFIAFAFVEVVLSILTIVGVMVMMCLLHWKLALFTLLPIPLMLALTVVFHRQLHATFRRWWHYWAQLTAIVADALPGVRVIKAFGQERREVERFGGKSSSVFDEELTFIGVVSTFGPLMMFCSQLGWLIIWLVGGWWVVQGQIGIGTLVAFTGFLALFMRPIHNLAHMDEMFNRAATSAQRIFEVLDSEPAIFTKSEARTGHRDEGRIELQHVSFSYDGIRRVLRDIDLIIPPGEMVGLAGPSGGGKTTTVNLICRFYDVLEGRILIDGIDVRDYDLEDLRRQIGVVLQEPFLFHGTVAENIAYGNPGATLEQIIGAAGAANAHDFIVGFPDGYDTLVGERGQSLSGGERQRISIARAILNNPRILILDEATSSVDTETEKLIQEALDRLIADRTTIAIAHRLSTLRKADRLVILKDGQIIEQGTHEQLAAREDGLYAKLLRMQTEMQSVMAIGE